MELAGYLTAFVTLFVIIDPIGLMPIVIALTPDMTAQERRHVAYRAFAIAIPVLAVFGLAGENLLGAIGISLPAFRIAGGILLFLTALDMLFERRTERREGHEPPPAASDPSVFPLATPLLAGPGSIATMILLVNEGSGFAHTAMIHLMMLLVMAIAFLLFQLATPLGRMLGRTGIMVVTRLLGMLLAALSIQFVIDGLKGAGVV